MVTLDIRMSFRAGYLTPRETEIWSLRRRTPNQSEIARALGVTRQAINISLGIIESKVERTFQECLDANNLQPRRINLVEGVMEAYSPAYQLPVIVSLSVANGLKVWYLYEGRCGRCDLERGCRRALLEEARERGVELEPEETRLEPTRLAHRIFSRYLTEEHNVD
jgi:hypothetical protein